MIPTMQIPNTAWGQPGPTVGANGHSRVADMFTGVAPNPFGLNYGTPIAGYPNPFATTNPYIQPTTFGAAVQIPTAGIAQNPWQTIPQIGGVQPFLGAPVAQTFGNVLNPYLSAITNPFVQAGIANPFVNPFLSPYLNPIQFAGYNPFATAYPFAGIPHPQAIASPFWATNPYAIQAVQPITTTFGGLPIATPFGVAAPTSLNPIACNPAINAINPWTAASTLTANPIAANPFIQTPVINPIASALANPFNPSIATIANPYLRAATNFGISPLIDPTWLASPAFASPYQAYSPFCGLGAQFQPFGFGHHTWTGHPALDAIQAANTIIGNPYTNPTVFNTWRHGWSNIFNRRQRYDLGKNVNHHFQGSSR